MHASEGLLQAILEAPADDTPRLVFADWLDEHGQADRADFIRLQIELAKMTLYDRRRPALTQREYDLFARHGSAWSAPLIGRVRRWQFRRGFVEQVKLEVWPLLQAGDMLARFAPVRELLIEDPDRDGIENLADWPRLARVETLDLTFSRMGDGALRALLASPHLGNLRELVLKWCDLTLDGLRALATSPALAALEELDLECNEVGGEAVLAFLNECRLPRLNRLCWGLKDWSPELLRALPGLPLLPRLKSLNLLGSKATEEDLLALAGARLDGLDELNLAGKVCTPAVVAALAANPSLRRLRKLELSGNPIGDAGAAALAGSPLAGTLEELKLKGCDVGWRGVRALARSPHLGRLVLLDLSDNPILDGGPRALAGSETLAALQAVSINQCGVSSGGIRALLQSPLIDRLGWLDVGRNYSLGPRTIGELPRCLGDGWLRHDDMDAYYSTAWALGNARANPPRCLRGFLVRHDSPLARQAHEKALRGHPEYVTFELCHPDPAQRPVALGYWLHDHTAGGPGRMLVTPMAIRWEPSGEVVELFDAEQHGYLAEYGSNCTITGSGPRIEWECPHPGCSDHAFIACFQYRDDCPPERHLERWFAPQDQFREFRLYAWCRQRDGFTFVTESECK
jgi:uncharacterized protein (TIGR02996 family)